MSYLYQSCRSNELFVLLKIYSQILTIVSELEDTVQLSITGITTPPPCPMSSFTDTNQDIGLYYNIFKNICRLPEMLFLVYLLFISSLLYIFSSN
jgi:hypothetical protein